MDEETGKLFAERFLLLYADRRTTPILECIRLLHTNCRCFGVKIILQYSESSLELSTLYTIF